MKLRTTLQRVSTQRRLAAGISAAILLATLVSANAVAKSYKPFELTVSPNSIGTGSVVQIWVQDDPNSQQNLGSLEVALPSGYSWVQSPSPTFLPTGPSAVFLDSTTTPSTPTPTLLVQNLNLAPGQSNTITVSGVNGCGASAWTITAQQANQWNSTNSANDLTLASPVPAPTVLTACHLAFVAQPADAGATQTITSKPLNPTGTPLVTVQLQDANNNAVTGVQVAVTLAIDPTTEQLDASTASVTLNGPGPVTTSSSTGNATFSPSITPTLNTGYTSGGGTFRFTASASNVASTNSSQFRVWGNATPCGSTTCTESLSAPGGETFNVTTPGNTATGLGGSVNIASFDCSSTASGSNYGGVPGLPGTYVATWTATGATGSTATKQTAITIPQSILTADVTTSDATVNQTNALLETHYMVCMSAPHPFTVAWTPFGPSDQQAQPDPAMSSLMGGTWYRGLLPDCQDVSNATPCVQSRAHGTSGLTVTVLSAVTDPMGR